MSRSLVAICGKDKQKRGKSEVERNRVILGVPAAKRPAALYGASATEPASFLFGLVGPSPPLRVADR